MFNNERILLFLVVVLLVFMCPLTIYAFPEDTDTEDVINSSDHPAISRFPGSYIRYYEAKNYDQYILPLSGLKTEDEDFKIEGKLTRHFYVIPKKHSTLEIFRNYETALKNNGFEIIAQQEDDLEESFHRNIYSGIRFLDCEGTSFEAVRSRIEGSRYLAGKLERAEGDVYISLFIAKHNFYGSSWEDGTPVAYQVVVEEKDLQDDLIDIQTDFESVDLWETESSGFSEDADTEDVINSSDHPAISRFPGSYIRYYDAKNYDQYTIPPVKLEAIDEEQTVTVEGKLTKSFYVIPDRHSTLEIYRNYEIALKEAGFEMIGQQEDDLEESFHRNLYSGIHFLDCEGTCFEAVRSRIGGSRYLAGKLERAEGDVYISLFIAKHNFYGSSWQDGTPAVFQVVIEETDLQTDLISVSSMIQDLESKGKVSIYGVYFDTDSDRIKSESEPMVENIARVLTDNPELTLHVVGHTDNTGGFDYNLDLSRRRAEALVNKLASEFGIDQNRLNPYGVGPLAPVGSNETENGRAQNRRVELVKRK